jgi:hypothetical protein
MPLARLEPFYVKATELTDVYFIAISAMMKRWPLFNEHHLDGVVKIAGLQPTKV